jgi:multiple sugar transport system ATP-binding protein
MWSLTLSELTLSRLEKSFSGTEVIKGIDLDVEPQEFVVFVGPSGCGKSTLLRMIAGLEATTAGDIVIAGNRVNDLPPVKRGIAMVFQSYALYPHMSVFENIAFPLRVERLPEAQIKAKVEEAARILQLMDHLQKRPGTLSGGQRQRVAIGRAIVREPRIFLFDEPLSNLDAALRTEMRIELMRLHKDLGATMIYVTHDQVEAMTMADKIVVLNSGRIEQVGSPLELYNRPRNRFVAGFIGNPKMNFIEGTATAASGEGLTVDLGPHGSIRLPRPAPASLAGQKVAIGIRPEHVELGADGFKLTLAPTLIERLGIHTIAYAPLGPSGMFTALFDGEPLIEAGRNIDIGIDPAQVHVFDAGGQAIGATA